MPKNWLTSAIDQILTALPDDMRDSVKPELMQCYMEINTRICRNVREVGEDLRDKLTRLESIIHPMGVRLLVVGHASVFVMATSENHKS
jgi:carboxylate-amine ligase